MGERYTSSHPARPYEHSPLLGQSVDGNGMTSPDRQVTGHYYSQTSINSRQSMVEKDPYVSSTVPMASIIADPSSVEL